MRKNSLAFFGFFILAVLTCRSQSAEIDTSVYYRITSLWQGDEKSLDILNDGKNEHPWLTQTEDVSGQWWKFSPLPGGYYRLTCMWLGDGKSLDIINDGENNNRPVMANTGLYSGQFWKLQALPDGYYRLTTNWQGDNKSLDIINDEKGNDQVWLADTGQYSGQFWKLTPGISVGASAAPKQ